jgi:hypothetical protein
MTELDIRKVYIDSRFKTNDSVSSSNCRIPLPQTLQLPEGCKAYLDDISIPNTIYNVEENINDKLYFQRVVRENGTNNLISRNDFIFTVPSTNYTGDTLIDAIDTLLNNQFGANSYTTTYDNVKNTITITSNVADTYFHIWSNTELIAGLSYGNAWSGSSYDSNNLMSFNRVIRNISMAAEATTYTSGFLDLLGIHNIYISSSNLSSLRSLGARGENNIIKKVQVSQPFGYYIIDQTVHEQDYFDVSKRVLSDIQFTLSDVYGSVLNLKGSDWSASLIFSME